LAPTGKRSVRSPSQLYSQPYTPPGSRHVRAVNWWRRTRRSSTRRSPTRRETGLAACARAVRRQPTRSDAECLVPSCAARLPNSHSWSGAHDHATAACLPLAPLHADGTPRAPNTAPTPACVADPPIHVHIVPLNRHRSFSPVEAAVRASVLAASLMRTPTASHTSIAAWTPSLVDSSAAKQPHVPGHGRHPRHRAQPSAGHVRRRRHAQRAVHADGVGTVRPSHPRPRRAVEAPHVVQPPCRDPKPHMSRRLWHAHRGSHAGIPPIADA
jgi:hypothetical protein